MCFLPSHRAWLAMKLWQALRVIGLLRRELLVFPLSEYSCIFWWLPCSGSGLTGFVSLLSWISLIFKEVLWILLPKHHSQEVLWSVGHFLTTLPRSWKIQGMIQLHLLSLYLKGKNITRANTVTHWGSCCRRNLISASAHRREWWLYPLERSALHF